MAKSIDFFAASSLPHPKSEYTDEDGRRVTMEHGLTETYAFGWSADTTFGRYERHVSELLGIVGACEQTVLIAAVVLLDAGMETLKRWAVERRNGKQLGEKRVPTAKKVAEDLREYIDEYRDLFRDAAALDRLHAVRNAILHEGMQVRTKTQKTMSDRGLVGEDILLTRESVDKALKAGKTFAAAVERAVRLAEERRKKG